MALTVGELREALEGMDDATEVRLATQPSWPMEHTARDIVVPYWCGESGSPEVVYLFEGEQVGYLPGDVTERAGT